jgi:Epoxide hydrolase N terminus
MSATASIEQPAGDKAAIRPFQARFSDEDLAGLRRRINATRWPERETVDDDSQGVPLAMMQDLARYWGSDYDWRACEAKLNALPQFITEIDGLDIHFIHVRSAHEGALPLIITHRWQGSIIEQLKVIEPLTNPNNQPRSCSASTQTCPARHRPSSSRGLSTARRRHPVSPTTSCAPMSS